MYVGIPDLLISICAGILLHHKKTILVGVPANDQRLKMFCLTISSLMKVISSFQIYAAV